MDEREKERYNKRERERKKGEKVKEREGGKVKEKEKEVNSQLQVTFLIHIKKKLLLKNQLKIEYSKNSFKIFFLERVHVNAKQTRA